MSVIFRNETQSIQSIAKSLFWYRYGKIALNLIKNGSNAKINKANIYIYIYIYIQGAYDKFPAFFGMGTFIDNTHMKL